MGFIIPRARKFQLVPAGSHRAVCFRIIDLGTHQSIYGDSRLIRLDFELTDELLDDGRPMSLSKLYYNPNMGEKSAWRRDCDTWLNLSEAERENFDMAVLVGKPALLTVIHDSRGEQVFANVAGISALPKSMAKPEPVNPSTAFFLDDFNEKAFDALPDKVKDKVRQSKEWQTRDSRGAGANNSTKDFDEDIPF